MKTKTILIIAGIFLLVSMVSFGFVLDVKQVYDDTPTNSYFNFGLTKKQLEQNAKKLLGIPRVENGIIVGGNTNRIILENN